MSQKPYFSCRNALLMRRTFCIDRLFQNPKLQEIFVLPSLKLADYYYTIYGKYIDSQHPYHDTVL
jgi:hypothetical protein